MPETTVVVARLGQLEAGQVGGDSDDLIDGAKRLEERLGAEHRVR